ncbi:hypothetical protein [Aurantimonas sp. 22II-16-19i]|uniref:hypothetical protein n=1 Tax=Aurantimonas sp. 22II-16-19i TaxID=1317114 RepID=UPI00111C2957|nr:hypothetical protein [Aurantimonas sp. 22II-16-19i]
MARHQLTHAELEEQLREQLGMLQRAAHAFDAGYRSEAKRMAVSLRNLLHSARNPSLLKRLGRNELDFVDTAAPLDPENLLSQHRLILLQIKEGRVSFGPRLDDGTTVARQAFDDWWSTPVLGDNEKRQLSRADVVLCMADQDGGAHVDGSLRTDYAAFSRSNSLGWTMTSQAGGQQALSIPEGATIRQISHEVLRTLVFGYARSVEDVDLLRQEPEVNGGCVKFPPWGDFYADCHAGMPLIAGAAYSVRFVLGVITAGSVRPVVGGSYGDPVTTPGEHLQTVVAGSEHGCGVYADYTDAVLKEFNWRRSY